MNRFDPQFTLLFGLGGSILFMNLLLILFGVFLPFNNLYGFSIIGNILITFSFGLYLISIIRWNQEGEFRSAISIIELICLGTFFFSSGSLYLITAFFSFSTSHPLSIFLLVTSFHTLYKLCLNRICFKFPEGNFIFHYRKVIRKGGIFNYYHRFLDQNRLAYKKPHSKEFYDGDYWGHIDKDNAIVLKWLRKMEPKYLTHSDPYIREIAKANLKK